MLGNNSSFVSLYVYIFHCSIVLLTFLFLHVWACPPCQSDIEVRHAHYTELIQITSNMAV